ncbi:MAG TPA: DUF1622 domain-containing protein [Geminicoccus sp.]|jgi:uncharacterized membrane protein|uniref:DUF1622 domain-containing protein n=1 Tax=Geminicoccus sp. TaxID=2024832 RepID=UPI002E342ED3|nr:DUF1622 domain-containing protein [Geminicoccus sp.]HEX2527667.1 DUF1622 domain-containing protein [Geminicoccus sp.]
MKRYPVVRGSILAALAAATVLVPGLARAEQAAPALAMTDGLEVWLHWTARAIELVGVGIIVVGAVVASLRYLVQALRAGSSTGTYEAYRASLGRAILLGLEFLVAADIIGTVAVEPTLQNLGVLALIVLIRTFLSFSLEVEIQGRWPWQQQAPAPRVAASGESREPG